MWVLTFVPWLQKAVADKEQEYAEKRRRNMEYRREIERQRAFDRRRAKNGKAPGAMPTEEVLMNRHRVKVAVINAAAQPASKRTQHRRGKTGSLRRSGGLSRAGSSALA